MDLVQQIDELMRRSRISPQRSTFATPEKPFDVSTIQQVKKSQPASLFHSGLQMSARSDVEDFRRKSQGAQYQVVEEPVKKQFHEIGSEHRLKTEYAQSITAATDVAVAQLLMPVKNCFSDGKFGITLQSSLGKLSARALEAEVGSFYLRHLGQYKKALSAQESTSVPSFQEIYVFTRALCKYLIDLYKLPQYGAIGTCQDSIIKAKAFHIPQKKLIYLVKAEYYLSKMSQKEQAEDITPVEVDRYDRAVSAKKQQQVSQRLYLDHQARQFRLKQLHEEHLRGQLDKCTFVPDMSLSQSQARRATDLGISQYLERYNQLRKADKEQRIQGLLQYLKDEAKFFRLRLTADFLEDVTNDLWRAQDASSQHAIIKQLRDIFHYKYLELQKSENEELIKSGKIYKIKVNFSPEDTILLSGRHPAKKEDVQTELELHKLQRQIIINEELERYKALQNYLDERQKRAESRARLAKAGMKGGGAVYGQLNDKLSVCDTVNDAAEAVRNVSKGGVVTLYSAAGSAKQ